MAINTNNPERLFHIDGYDKKGGMPFDLVVEKERKSCIEVSFQVTTNSTIERKLDKQRPPSVSSQKRLSDCLCLDGAGNFNVHPPFQQFAIIAIAQ